jgi:hypothetical protein
MVETPLDHEAASILDTIKSSLVWAVNAGRFCPRLLLHMIAGS